MNDKRLKVRREKNGVKVWTGVVRDPEGGQRRFSMESNRTKDVERAWNAFLVEVRDGKRQRENRRTVADMLEEWRKEQQTSVEPSTYENYRRHIEQRLAPTLGKKRLDRLTATDIREAMDAWRTQGRLDKKKGVLSEDAIFKFRLTLSIACEWAVKQGYIATNPCARVKRPKVVEKERAFLNPDQARPFLDAFVGDELYVPTLLGLTCGTRRSETLGATEADVNYATGRLTVRRAVVMGTKGTVRIKPPKTQTSARTLVLPAFALTVLKQQRVKRIQAALAEGRQLDPTTPLCLRDNGMPWKPHDLSREFGRAVNRKKLARVSYHGLRHSFATINLRLGGDLKHTSAALGHQGVAITGRIYAHVLDAVQEEAAVRLDNLLGRDPASERDPNVTQAGSGA
jgi:integrase